MKARASAPGKVILLGEHFVVYGKPAIVLAIDRRARVTAELGSDETVRVTSDDLRVSGCFHEGKFEPEQGGSEAEVILKPLEAIARRLIDISGRKTGVTVNVHSDIPIGAGLGSSAAVAVASTSALSQLLGLGLSKEEIFRFAYDAERLIHGTPSGIDPAISTYGGILHYVRDKGITHLNVGGDLQLVIGDTGMKRSTGDLVGLVRELSERHPSVFGSILESAEKVVSEAERILKLGDMKGLGDLMNMDQGLLSAVGVSNEVLERLIYSARRAGAYGAKLTGAGGGGCIVALTPRDKVEDVVAAIIEAGGTAFTAKKTDEGVRTEA